MSGASGWAGLTQNVTPAQETQIMEAALLELKNLPRQVLRDRAQLQSKAQSAVTTMAGRLGIVVIPQLAAAIARALVARVGGLGVFDELLPPSRTDLSEIVLNPDGKLWLRVKGDEFFREYDHQTSLYEVWRSVEALLAPLGRTLSEAQPDVDARLPRSEGMGGARIKILHPVIAPGLGYPSISIRLFEPTPVAPEKIVQWEVCPQAVMDTLLSAVTNKARVLIVGGTATGKTTFLSALTHGIPLDARIVKIEDPDEIWLPHKNVTTIEARPHVIGSEIPEHSLSDGVDSAMRMSPNWLIVGEVRTGGAALSLFRAQMSDHPGLSTLHAESPEVAVHRISVLLWADKQVRVEAAKEQFAMSVDLLVQLGWMGGKRRVLGVWEVAQKLKAGDVAFREIYSIGHDNINEILRTHGG